MTNQDQAPENHVGEVDSLLQKKEFGVELRIARESENLSVADVAEKLLVSMDIITAIEESEVDKLPALTFTKGYIRSYARLLEIPADNIISEYLKVAPDQKPALSSRSVLPMQASSEHFFIKIISAAFVFFAVIILLYWLYQTDFTMRESEQNQHNTVQSLQLGNIKPTEAQMGTAQNDSRSSEVKSTGDTPVTDQATTQANKLQASKSQVQSNKAKLNTADTKSVFAQTQSNIKATAQVNTDSPVANDVMLLTALESSWVEAKDQTGQRLYYQLLNAGEDIKLHGKSPFTVFLGNARKVRIEINQKIVSFDHLVGNNKKTVRIKIEANSLVSSEPR